MTRRNPKIQRYLVRRTLTHARSAAFVPLIFLRFEIFDLSRRELVKQATAYSSLALAHKYIHIKLLYKQQIVLI